MATGIDNMIGWLVKIGLILLAGSMAYNIRLYAINTYGLVIHEFDPWFNYRATEYLWANGISKFNTWFDHESWYPLGRPVGTTIYPGMQITSCLICSILNKIGIEISLNDVCCYVPAWLGVTASYFLGMMTWECSGSSTAGVMATLIMAIIPAHIMRSVGGGYDNESVAMTCMMMTFFFWVRSLRGSNPNAPGYGGSTSWMWGIATGFAYIYMAATWGGYVFVLNMIGIHCGILVCFGRFSKELHRAYTLFYFIGTLGAIQVPVIGYTPIKSLEQLPCAAVFVGMQLLELCRYLRENKPDMDNKTYRLLQAKVFGVAACAALAVIMTLAPTGYFGPISSRIRSLFVAHTRTGNPLVDSVAEHQPASPQAYWQYLYLMCYIAPIGFAISLYKGFVEASNASLFLTSYGVVAYYFSLKMARLIVLIGPVASALSGMAFGLGIEWAIEQLLNENVDDEVEEAPAPSKKEVKETASKELKGKPGKRKKQPKQSMKIDNPFKPLVKIYRSDTGKTARKVIAVAITVLPAYYSLDFYQYSQRLAEAMSNPSIMFQGTLQNGETVMVDDYREAYWWLKENTPQDSRVMAWWDYGYQIAGIANRTTIADGNTWNHEHIATLGKCLVSPEKEAHQMVRHLADYVLLWSGGGGDDLAKSPHMARISNSVYEGICGGDPTCRTFGFTDNQMTPTPMMEASLLYRLHSSGTKGKMHDTNLFDDVFSSKFRKVRIFKVKSIDKKSKAWVADPANRICDAPGSWYCSGQYPPKFRKFIDKKKDFAQLEDFNKKGDAKSKKYNEEYMKRMGGH